VSEGTGSAVPAGILTNKDLMALVDTDDEWIRTRTGISQRHILGKGESLTMLGADAATKVNHKPPPLAASMLNRSRVQAERLQRGSCVLAHLSLSPPRHG
jgi:hypothetical protein